MFNSEIIKPTSIEIFVSIYLANGFVDFDRYYISFVFEPVIFQCQVWWTDHICWYWSIYPYQTVVLQQNVIESADIVALEHWDPKCTVINGKIINLSFTKSTVYSTIYEWFGQWIRYTSIDKNQVFKTELIKYQFDLHKSIIHILKLIAVLEL